MMKLRDKINNRLDELQELLESNKHLDDLESAYEKTLEISKFWSVLSEEDRDYVQCAQHAIEEGLEWNV